MGLFSFIGKNKQDRTADDSGHFYRTADDAAPGEHTRSKRASGGDTPRRSRESRSGGDPMLPEKKRARRRLVGAIALALAAAVGLPMLLDSEPKPLAGDIAIQIPPKDKVAPLPVPSDSAPKGASVGAADSVDRGEEIVEPPQAAARPAPAAARPAPALAVAEVRAQDKTAAASPTVKPEAPKAEHKLDGAKAEHKLDPAKPEHKAEAKPDVAKADPAKPEHKAAPKPDAKAEPKLADKPKAVKSEEKPVHPLAADDSARALAILEGKAAQKAASDKAAAAKEPDAAGEKVVLQVAALGSAEKAAELQARLREAGIASYTQKLSRPGGDLIRVKVGPYSRDEADKVRARLGKLGLSGTPGPA